MADKEVEGKEAGKEVDPVLENTTEWVDEPSPTGNSFGCAAAPARCPQSPTPGNRVSLGAKGRPARRTLALPGWPAGWAKGEASRVAPVALHSGVQLHLV